MKAETPERKEQKKAATRRWWARNRTRLNAEQRLIHRDRHLGKGAVEYFDGETQKQKGLCAVCEEPLIKSPRADHNHETGKWRGVVCPRCNIALGYYENSGLMQKALAYLKRWS